MNEIIEQLNERKSVRQFEQREIPQEMRDTIINSALQAPTAGNQILYSIIDVRSQSIKDRLAITCDNQPFIASAPMVLVFLADCRRWLDAYEYAGCEPRQPRYGDFLLACADAFIAAQNTVVATHSLGIGSCYIGDILENREQHMQLLGLDKYTVPVCMVVYGYPTQSQIDRRKPRRFDARYIVHTDRYARTNEDDMRDAFSTQQNSQDFDFDDYIRKFHNRKYASGFAQEMNRSAAEYIGVFCDNIDSI